MNFFKILWNTIFGWKTSDLIEYMIQTGRYNPDVGGPSFLFMCITIRSYTCRHSVHTSKIESKIIHANTGRTLSGYLYNKLGRYPTTDDRMKFWKEFIQELRENGQ